MHGREETWTEVLGNHHYRGAAFGWIFLLLIGAINLFRGSVHTFAEDGGAERIAGLDLSQGGDVILALFAASGVSQLLMSAIDFSVALRFRRLAPLLLGYHLIHQIGLSLVIWFWRPIPVPAPGKYGAVAIVPLVALALWAALRKSEASEAASELAPSRTASLP